MLGANRSRSRGTEILALSRIENLRRTRCLVPALMVVSACTSSPQAIATDAAADASTDAGSNGVCCPIEDGFEGCAGSHAPGGWAPTPADCSDPSILYGAGRYLSIMTNVNRCKVLVELAPAWARQCEAGTSAGDAGAPIGGGVCCVSSSIPCEGSGGGGWASRAEACSTKAWPMDTGFTAYRDAHGCFVTFPDTSVCCGCPPDASVPDAGADGPSDAAVQDGSDANVDARD